MWGIPRGKPRCNFSSRYLALFDNKSDGGSREVGKKQRENVPPQKIHANDGPACQIIAGGKIS